MIKDELEEFGFYTFKHADEKFNELKEQFIEMSQIKSDFDVEKFTVKKEGGFIAHQFHFLMRQYSLALTELRKMLIEKEELERKIEENKDKGKEKVLVYDNEGITEKYADLYLKELINRLDMVELGITGKAMTIRAFEACRLKLIELNGGVPTNKQYQREEPKYLKWQLQNIAIRQNKQAHTGVTELTWKQIDSLEENALINPDFQVKMLEDDGTLNLTKCVKDVAKQKDLDYNPTKELIERKKPINI